MQITYDVAAKTRFIALLVRGFKDLKKFFDHSLKKAPDVAEGCAMAHSSAFL